MPPELAVVFPHARVTGGVERVVLDLLKYQSQRRETCFVGYGVDEPGLTHVAVSRRRVPSSLRPLAFRRAAGRAVRALGARTTLSFGAVCPPGDVYWVQSVHASWLADGGDVFYRGRRVPPALRRALLRHQVLLRLEHDYFVNHAPRAILCTSPREVDDLARIYGVPRERMHAIPNPFDGRLFAPARRRELRTEMRAKLGASAGDVVVLMVANEWHRKGLGTLLKAVAQQRDPRVRIDLVGRRPPTDYLPIAARLGLADRLHWHGPSADVAVYHAAADVFALPTTYEPFGLVIIEAMASGLPVVTSALAGAAAAISPGVDGYLLADPADDTELSRALDALLDPDRRAAVGAAAAVAAAPYEVNQVMARADEIMFGPRPA